MMFKNTLIHHVYTPPRYTTQRRIVRTKSLDIVQQSEIVGHGLTAFVFLTSIYNYMYYRKIRKSIDSRDAHDAHDAHDKHDKKKHSNNGTNDD